ncbi:MAG: pyrroline-5-carboxylate reductase [Ignavibacteriota bacterium]
MTLGFLGTGAIASAMVTGLCSSGEWKHSIFVSPRNAAVAGDLSRRYAQVSVAASNQQVLDDCDTVVIAVRPQIAGSVLEELRFRSNHSVISLVSGYPIERLHGLVAPATRIGRAVPLPSAAQRRSPTAIYPRDAATVDLFALLGEGFAVDTEHDFDVLCVATATMATYFAFADGAASWLVRNGIPAAQAREYMATLYAGLAATAVEHPERSFQELADDHATRGGTNEQVLTQMKGHGVFDRYSECLDGILRRVTAR